MKGIFDVFVSSAHAGLRKPDPKIYDYALQQLNFYAQAHVVADGKGIALGWGDGIRAEDVLFLDDIGENLKAAKKAGFRTIKVHLGRAYEAVEELEKVTGLALDGGHPKVSSAPKIPKARL